MLKEDGKQVVHFNGHSHKLIQLLGKASTAPLIEVSKGEIVLDDGALPVKYGNHSPDLDEHIVLYKHDGKFYVLYGRDVVRKGFDNSQLSFKGRLISSPALKQCRIVEDTVQPAAPASPPGFENRPRFASNARDREQRPAPRNGNYNGLNRSNNQR